MGNEQHRHAEFRLQLCKKPQNLCLNRHIERRRRLVGDEQVGLVCQSHGNHDALALAAGQFVGIGGQALFRVANADQVQELQDTRTRGAGRKPFV